MRNPAKPYIFEKVRRARLHVRWRATQFEAIWKLPIVDILEIRFVKDDKNVFRDTCHECVDRLRRDDRARGIIGIADKDQARLVSDGIRHSGQIMLPALEWNDDGLAVRGRHFHFINHERQIGHDRFVPRREKCSREESENFVGSIAEDYLIRRSVYIDPPRRPEGVSPPPSG